MNDLVKDLIGMGPGLAQAAQGNGTEFAAFMEGWNRAQQEDEQRQRLKQQDSLAMEDRSLRLEDRQRGIDRQTAADQVSAQQRTQQQAMQALQMPGHLAELGATADDPQGAQALIESAMPTLMKAFGQESMAFGQPAVEMSTRTITGRQKKQVEQFVEAALKTSFVADNPDSDPELVNLPEHIAKIVGKPQAKLSELQQFASLPVGKPAKARGANPTEASLAYEAAGGDAAGALKLLNPDKPEKPAKAGYRWLSPSGGGEPFEWPDDKPAPRGAKPYDQVAARQSGGANGGQPSAYSVERASRTISSVDKLMSKVNRWTTGMGSVLAGIPETDARNFKAELDTLKANIAFNELTAMREASKTGGALGAVSDKEMNLLQSALGALDAGQSPENIRQQLQQIKESVQRWQSAQGVKPAISHTPTNVAPKRNPFRP